jgi:cytosine/adenosine deaminase-related metal-dependent hydrolase
LLTFKRRFNSPSKPSKRPRIGGFQQLLKSEAVKLQPLTIGWLHDLRQAGAEVLGRAHDIGQIRAGFCADLALFRTDTLAMAGGAVHDPVGALMLCASANADFTVVHGRVVVRQGQLATVDLGPLIERHNALARQLAEQAR